MTKPASVELPLSSRHCARGFRERYFYLVSSPVILQERHCYPCISEFLTEEAKAQRG